MRMKTLVRLRLVRMQKPMNRFPADHHDTDSMTMIENHICHTNYADTHQLLITMMTTMTLVIMRMAKKESYNV